MSNATAIAKPHQFLQMVEKGLLKALCEVLKMQEQTIITIAIEGISNILKSGMDNFMDDGVNRFAILAESYGMLDSLENLQYHKNHQIYEKAVEIIEKYFDEENDQVMKEIDNATSQPMGQE